MRIFEKRAENVKHIHRILNHDYTKTENLRVYAKKLVAKSELEDKLVHGLGCHLENPNFSLDYAHQFYTILENDFDYLKFLSEEDFSFVSHFPETHFQISNVIENHLLNLIAGEMKQIVDIWDLNYFDEPGYLVDYEVRKKNKTRGEWEPWLGNFDYELFTYVQLTIKIVEENLEGEEIFINDWKRCKICSCLGQ